MRRGWGETPYVGYVYPLVGPAEGDGDLGPWAIARVGGSYHFADTSRWLAVEFGAKLAMVESSYKGDDDFSFRDVENRVPHLVEMSNVVAKELRWLLVDAAKIMLHAGSSTRGHVVVGEDFLQLFPRSDGVWGKACEPAHGGWREHDGEIICHDVGVSSSGADGGGISLQPLSWVHPSFVGLDSDDFETTGPLERSERPSERWGPF